MHKDLQITNTLGELGLKSLTLKEIELFLTGKTSEADLWMADFIRNAVNVLNEKGDKAVKKAIAYIAIKIGFHFSKRVMEHLDCQIGITAIEILDDLTDATAVAIVSKAIYDLFIFDRQRLKEQREREFVKGGEVKTFEHLE